MNPIYVNKTNLTLDMYKRGIVENYKASHNILRAVSTAYAIVLLLMSYVFNYYMNWTVCIPLFLFGAAIVFWNIWGYKMGTKKSFMKFALMHESHYQIEMEYRFLEDRFEQETSKTELTVMYKDFDIVYVLDKLLLMVFNKQVVIIDKETFIDADYKQVVEFIKSKDIKVKEL